MGETLQSILCGEPWAWDSDDACHITFENNGAGELVARSELCIWIAAEIEWKCSNPEVLKNVISVNETSSFWSYGSTARQIAQFDIEVTLTKRRVSTLGSALERYKRINDELLSEAAFAPKVYTVRLEHGVFRSPASLSSGNSQWSPRYNLQIIFDKSPYPPENEWKDTSGGPEAIKFWEWTEFCSGKLPAKDNSGMFSGCVSS
ncbi:hypothetical protein ColLi_03432 [Colletotrichum liriopes]|uniref:Uncharacterized protein n=1 Tax=Colletotrichum liriopes TaxID=708192 RepID=A0AA37GGN0_9PEZI|nr:hypothetical protein ColLi_03432 [Colletotrichum liriopes]